MAKIIVKLDNFSPKNEQSQSRPIAAVLLFLVLVPVLCFYCSQKVILWESKDVDGINSVFRQAVLLLANASQNIKERLNLDSFFEQESATWQSLKNSPLVFGQPEASLSSYRDNGVSVPAGSGNGSSTAQLVPAQIRNEPVASSTQAASSTAASATSSVPTVRANAGFLRKVGQTAPAPVSNVAKKSAPFRILIVGDSFVAAGGGLGDPLERTLLNFKDTVVTRQGKVSSGLSRADYFDWPTLAQKLITQYEPNVGIMMFGANDGNPVIDARGKVLASYGSANWDDQYRQRIGQILDMFTSAHAEIFVIGEPIMKSQKLSQTMKHINSLNEEEVKKYPNAHFIPIWNLLTDKNGNYTDYLLDKSGNERLIRTSDGVHLQYFAGYYVVDAIVNQMETFLDLRAK
jgi:hypothetical protein